MVPVNAARLLELFDAGQLDVVGGVTGIPAADVVINAVNPPPHSVPQTAAELAASLVDERLAAPHPSGGLVPADPRVHIVGDLAGDGSFITSGIPGVAAQGAAAARAIGAALT